MPGPHLPPGHRNAPGQWPDDDGTVRLRVQPAPLLALPDDPDPDEAPGVITVRRVEAIAAKPLEQWTDAERAYIAHAIEATAERVRLADELIRPRMQSWPEMMVLPMASFSVLMAALRLNPITVDLADFIETDTAWNPPESVSVDQFRHVDGLPGISARCWADRWDNEAEEYHPCNAEAGNNDMGLCDDDMAKMRS